MSANTPDATPQGTAVGSRSTERSSAGTTLQETRKRTRTGCFVCKSRGKKCGGERPECATSLRLEFVCSYTQPSSQNDARHKRQKLENAMSALTRRQKLSAAHKTSPSGRPSISSLDQYDCEPLASCKSPAPDASRQTVLGPADPEKTTGVRTVCDPVRETALAALGKVDVNGNKDARHPIAVKIRVRLDTTILLDHSFSTPLHRVHSEHSRILRYAVAASKEWANDTQTDWNDVAHLWYVESRNGKKEVTGLEGALGFMNGFTEYEDRDLKLVVIHMYPRFPKVGCIKPEAIAIGASLIASSSISLIRVLGKFNFAGVAYKVDSQSRRQNQSTQESAHKRTTYQSGEFAQRKNGWGKQAPNFGNRIIGGQRNSEESEAGILVTPVDAISRKVEIHHSREPSTRSEGQSF
ncbi:DNA-binding transcriptional regulator ume6 [Elasticomyces elasticus]|nr:DNA-binding transcriptional regulator ume6 [Elasticomyces elasticus]